VVDNEILSASVLDQVYSSNQFSSDFSQVSAEVENELSDFIDDLESESTITSQEADVLQSYISEMANSTDLSDFKDYSIETENGISGSGSYSTKSKAILLTFMATARYGAAYWGAFDE